jgi:hypothetical protein
MKVRRFASAGDRLEDAGMKTLAALIALSLLGCDDREAQQRAAEAQKVAEKAKKDEVTAQLGPEVRKLVGKVDRLRPLLSGVPKAADVAAPPRTDPRMKLSETHLSDPAGNTDLLVEGELTLLRRGMLGTCSYYLRQPDQETSATFLEDVFRRGLRTRYFLVVRADETKKPRITGGSKYTDGTLEGDVAVFDLSADPPKPLGSFPIRAELTTKVKVRASASREDIQYALDEALRKTALDEVERLLQQ